MRAGGRMGCWLLGLAMGAPGARAGGQGPYPFQDAKLGAEARISDLLGRMTLAEKIDALGTNPTVPRLGVVGTGHDEGLHGVALGGPGGWEGRGQAVIPTTTFPQSRGLGQTWDPALLEQAASVEAYETRWAVGKYHRGGLTMRAPNADLSRDPRWGRSEESYGEDPFLVGTLATAFTRGLQGKDATYWETASLLKHFLANSNENGRDGSSSNFDPRLFHEYYSVPFRMAIEQGHANAMMASYNAWNKVPMTANPALREVVMKQWGFDGILCTDAGALTNMVKEHRYYPDMARAAAGAIHAGINQFLDTFKPGVTEALARKLITEQEIEGNLRGVFRVMLKLGMLDPGAGPYAGIGVNAVGPDPWWSEASKALARKVTDESIVLLKNEGGALPLTDAVRSIAVIGPVANRVALDWYSGTPPYTVTPVEGIKARAKGATVTFDAGTDVATAAAAAKAAEVAVVVVGNHPVCDSGWYTCPVPSDGKEAVDRRTLTLEQEELVKAVYAANPRTVVVLQASFPYTTTWTEAHVPAIVEMVHGSEEQGDGLADVLFGDYNPAGRLTQTWVANEAQLPEMMDYDLRHGRTYLYAKDKPLYAFGYGLSYTTFAYGNLRVSGSRLAPGGEVTVTVDVTNTGKRDGEEVAQLYIAHRGSAVARPLEELKGFARVRVRMGETVPVALRLRADDLAYWDEAAGRFAVERDRVEIRVGGSSDRIALKKEIAVSGEGR